MLSSAAEAIVAGLERAFKIMREIVTRVFLLNGQKFENKPIEYLAAASAEREN
jgi:hypothetical protein